MRKATRRRIWDVKLNPVRVAVIQAMACDLSGLDVQLLLTVTQIKSGEIDRHVHHVAVVMVKVCRALASAGVGPEALPACQRAAECLNSFEHGQVMAPADRQCLLDVFEWLQAQREAVGDAAFVHTAAPYLVAR